MLVSYRDMEKKKKRLTSAIDVLQSLFENGKSPLSSQYVFWRLKDDWEGAVGPTVAHNCTPSRFFRGTLYLSVKHPVWIQQLRFMTGEIKLGVNKYVGHEWVHEIKYFVEHPDEDSRPFYLRNKKK